MEKKKKRKVPLSRGSEVLRGLQAAQIWCPGARISGLSTSATCFLISMISGPLEENLLTTGDLPVKEASLPSPTAAKAPNSIAFPFWFLFVSSS